MKIKIKLTTGKYTRRSEYETFIIEGEWDHIHYVLNSVSQFILLEDIEGKKLIINKNQISTCEEVE